MDDVSEAQLREPLAVVAQLRPLGIEDQERLLEVASCAGVDLLVGEDRALRRAARRVADARRVVADDQDADVPRVLERAHSLQRNRPADVDVGRGDVDAELDAQRPPECQLLLETALRQQLDVVAGKGFDVVHGAVILGAPDEVLGRELRDRAAPHEMERRGELLAQAAREPAGHLPHRRRQDPRAASCRRARPARRGRAPWQRRCRAGCRCRAAPPAGRRPRRRCRAAPRSSASLRRADGHRDSRRRCLQPRAPRPGRHPHDRGCP